MEFYKIGWDEVIRMSVSLVHAIPGARIFGIPRGGSVVSAIMAFHGSKLVSDAQQADVIVDDIADRGVTLHAFTRPTAALIVRYDCEWQPTHWVTMINTSAYILFPWESEELVKLQTGFRSRD